jgi:hypothetical protein
LRLEIGFQLDLKIIQRFHHSDILIFSCGYARDDLLRAVYACVQIHDLLLCL